MTADPNPQLPGLPSSPLSAKLQPADSPNPDLRSSAMELWLHRITVVMFVFVCAGAGMLLVILPWMPQWTDNHLLTLYPALRPIIADGFVRGLCSGLGVLDIWIGFWEAIHYREGHRPLK